MDNRTISASRDLNRRSAQSYFQQADTRTNLVRDIVDEERKAATAKTAKLRSLRLAKEEEDRRKNADDRPHVQKTTDTKDGSAA
ncbi:MAG TPA: hypothetical protein VMS78_05360 [Rhizomicrobium sp.]|nr:hypothetical protein [Rhizomicrobium sp.]